jgi:putative transposase
VCPANNGSPLPHTVLYARYFRLFGLQPHRTEGFKLSNDPFFIEKLRDVVGLYLSTPDNALVICVDEKSQCQELERTQLMLPRLKFGSARTGAAHLQCCLPLE